MSMTKISPADFIDKNSENIERTKDGAEGSSKITVKNITHFIYSFSFINFFSFFSFSTTVSSPLE